MKYLSHTYTPAIVTISILIIVLGLTLTSFRFLKRNLEEVNRFEPLQIRLPIINLTSYEKLNKNGL